MLILKQIFKAEINVMSFEELDVLVLERDCLMVLFLILNVLSDLRNLGITHRKRAVALLPYERTLNAWVTIQPVEIDLG